MYISTHTFYSLPIVSTVGVERETWNAGDVLLTRLTFPR